VRYGNRYVVIRFLEGRGARTRHLRTDGIILWSYRDAIAKRLGTDKVLILSKGCSKTSRYHFRLVQAVATEMGFEIIPS